MIAMDSSPLTASSSVAGLVGFPWLVDGLVLTAAHLDALSEALLARLRFVGAALGPGFVGGLEVNDEHSITLVGGDRHRATLKLHGLRAVGCLGSPLAIDGPIERTIDLNRDGPTEVWLSLVVPSPDGSHGPGEDGEDLPTTAPHLLTPGPRLTPRRPPSGDALCIARVIEQHGKPALDPTFLGRAWTLRDSGRMVRRATRVLERFEAMEILAQADLARRGSSCEPARIALAGALGCLGDTWCGLDRDPLSFVTGVGRALVRMDRWLTVLDGKEAHAAIEPERCALPEDVGPAFVALETRLELVLERFEQVVGRTEIRPLSVKSSELDRIQSLRKEWHRIRLGFEEPLGQSLAGGGKSRIALRFPAPQGHLGTQPVDVRWSCEERAFPGGTSHVARVEPRGGECLVSFELDELERLAESLVVFVESHLPLERPEDLCVEIGQ